MRAALREKELEISQRRDVVHRLAAAKEGLTLRCAALSLVIRAQAEVWEAFKIGGGFQHCEELAAAAAVGPVVQVKQESGASAAAAKHSSGGGAAEGVLPGGPVGLFGDGSEELVAAARLEASALANVPHLATGASLLRIGSVTAEDIQAAKEMSVEAARAAWRDMTKTALQRKVEGDREGLQAVGQQMARLWCMLIVHNPNAALLFMATHMVTGEPASGPFADAGLSHWEAVVRGTQLTRVQAGLMTHIRRIFHAQLAKIWEHRTRLCLSISAAEQEGRSGAAAWPLTAAMASSVLRERTALVLCSLAFRAVLSDAQFALVASLSFPWWVNSATCCEAMEHFLKFEPQAFAPEESLLPHYAPASSAPAMAPTARTAPSAKEEHRKSGRRKATAAAATAAALAAPQRAAVVSPTGQGMAPHWFAPPPWSKAPPAPASAASMDGLTRRASLLSDRTQLVPPQLPVFAGAAPAAPQHPLLPPALMNPTLLRLAAAMAATDSAVEPSGGHRPAATAGPCSSGATADAAASSGGLLSPRGSISSGLAARALALARRASIGQDATTAILASLAVGDLDGIASRVGSSVSSATGGVAPGVVTNAQQQGGSFTGATAAR